MKIEEGHEDQQFLCGMDLSLLNTCKTTASSTGTRK